MASFFSPKHRSVVPRWRLFRSTVAMGELEAPQGVGMSAEPSETPTDQLRDWRANKTVWHATDLLSAAVVSSHLEVAKEAAHFLIAHSAGATPAALDLARDILVPAGETDVESLFEGDWKAVIRTLRGSVIRDPRSAMQWTDLGLAHTVLGNRPNAIRALSVAVALADENRFVLRSAARCFLHWGEPDRAQAVLRSSPATLADPWLMSAEVAISSARQRPSSLFTEARRMVKSGAFSNYDISELASGLGSLEFEAGSMRHALPMLQRAVLKPTENAVAQVEWVFNKRNKVLPGLEMLNVPRLYEANAVEYYFKGEWDEAIRSALKWLADQPFSSRPADLASYAASLLERYSDAVNLLEGARDSNPDDQMILNNLAYFSVMAGDIESGHRWIRKVKWDKVERDDRAVLMATAGLLEFRSGHHDAGRDLYLQAVRDGVRMEDPRLEAIALINLAREELTAGNLEHADLRLREARAAAKRAHGKDVQTMLRTLEARMERSPVVALL
jgi:tetratricopeptide (TPR) repeat protein